MVMSLPNKKLDLSIKIGKLNLINPIILASGTYGYNDEYEEFLDTQSFGALVTKGLTLKPKIGNPQPRIKEIKSGLINSIGLENVGIDAFIETKLPILQQKNIPHIVNIAGFSFEEYREISRISEINDIKTLEVNVSCPNVKGGCLDFVSDTKNLYKLICLIREVFSGTLIVKLSSNVSNPVDISKKIQQAGADAISAINTVRAMNIKVSIDNSKFKFNKIQGGMSGPAITPIALQYIYTISKEVTIPIIGMGGISSLSDMIEFTAVGSSAYQIGTANFINPSICDTLIKDLKTFLLDNDFNSFKEFIAKCRV